MMSEKDFTRDTASGALINTNINAYKQYKLNRDSSKTISELNTEIGDLKTQVEELKTLLYKVLEEKK
jgi:adenylate cyclase class IV